MSPVNHPLVEGTQLGKPRLPNRPVVAPMSRISATPNGLATAEMAQYYAAFAAGGFGMVITEGYSPTLLAARLMSSNPAW